ncbi:homeobox-leucine zipper protein ROC5-like isoform X2 [Ananas comosus]|uniref:Homeobox-leucine zipper protein ROC5-like isoform X2 n=1 Tax=Ananas comosus TaxID=4615 RepID=A0A6P5H5T9_ANACO|nr:homeobox-leucine zipper protein ROC5-like isoform X2 [Ananas comosus]
MSFGGLFDGGGGGSSGAFPFGSATMPPGAVSQPRTLSPAISKAGFSTSPALSLGLQTNLDVQGEMNRMGIMGVGGGSGGRAGSGDGDSMGRNKEDENESRSGGSDNLDGASGDDLDGNENPRKKKRYHRHTPQQIQELESLFKECPHPDEKQRLELSKRLCLESRQVKFWFQNRRTQMKTQIERHENALLRQENDKLRAENLTIREAMRNPICTNCGGPAMLGEVSLEEQHLRIENARLKDELDRVSALAGKFLGRPISALASPIPQMPNSSLELAVGTNGFAGLGSVAHTLSAIPDFVPSAMVGPITPPPTAHRMLDGPFERSVFLELALAAMEELVKMAQMEEPLWIPTFDGTAETLNYDEYRSTFPRIIGPRPSGYVSEATREMGMVIINSVALVETLMDANRWADMFPCMIARTSTTEAISSGVGGTRNGALQLMHAELQVLSPLVPVREMQFLRFCKQHAEGVWAVVDVSIDGLRDHNTSAAAAAAAAANTPYMSCRRLPSGCVVQDMPNGYSKVTWVEHAEYDETGVHQLYRPLLSSGLAFGARRWVATLQRQCQCLAILMSSSVPARDHAAITPGGRRSMLKLAQRMTDSFCAGVCASAAQNWRRLDEWGCAGVGDEVRVLTRQSVSDPGEPPGVVLSAATSVWLPVPPHRLFDFLRDERLRSQWDILSNGGPMQEMAHIAKGQHHGNAVSLLRAGAVNSNQSSMLILQETCTDASGSLVVYAPVDVPAMHLVMNGGDSAYVALLPSGFAILPDAPRSNPNIPNSNPPTSAAPSDANIDGSSVGGGSLVTVAFQILVNSLPTAKLTMESVETVNNLLTCTIQKIKAALQNDNIISP